MDHQNQSKGKSSVETANDPTGEQVFHALQWLFKYSSNEEIVITGDKYEFPELRNEKFGVKLIEAEVVDMPSYDDREEDEDDFETQFKMTFYAYLSYYKNDISTPEELSKLKKNIEKRLVDEDNDNGKVISQSVVDSNPEYHTLQVLFMSTLEILDKVGKHLESSLEEKYWKPLMNRLIQEGVSYNYSNVPASLCDSLRENINSLASKTSVDFHPNSSDIVRDLVHPALYSYIENVSVVRPEHPKPPPPTEGETDFWGRPYENSKFQWLPSSFTISDDGKCSIEEYINNLDRVRFGNLYSDLEKLFELFLPYFEEVWSYIKAMTFFTEEDDNAPDFYGKWDWQACGSFDLNSAVPAFFKLPPLQRQKVSFKGRELQVIVKIVDYTLQPQQHYEGVWHAEGMSHENIVMTGIYFLNRDAELKGGDLRFKRAFTVDERSRVFATVPQTRPMAFNEFSYEGYIPLGKFPTEEGYMLVFPNCHIHKINKLVNESSTQEASRRIIVFFVVNPEKRIISTREVAPQQSVISLSKAKEYRLELMAERKYDKKKLNIRDIELCEH